MLGLITMVALSFAGWRWGADSRNHGERTQGDNGGRDW